MFLKVSRTATVALALALLSAGCLSRANRTATTPSPGTARYGEGLEVPEDKKQEAAQPQQGGRQPAGGSTTTGNQAQPSAKPGAGPGQSVNLSADKINDLGGTGSAARFLLKPESYREIVVEIDYVSDKQPSDLAVSHLVETLRQVTGKKVTLRGGDQTSGGKRTYSDGDIEQLSDSRDHRSVAPTAALWIVYLDGSFDGNPNALGVAVAGTVAAVFQDRVRAAARGAGPLASAAEIERSTLVHEVGHLLSLVNLGDYRSPRDHEDSSHPGHSKNKKSVMYWAVERQDLVAQLFSEGPVYKFDADDLADLQDLREGRL